MSVFAAVMTGKGTGAISTIEVFGDSAEAVIKKIFKPAGGKRVIFKTGKILLGEITDGSETIDQVTIGCEGTNDFTINCHGNPIIVEMIMRLLSKEGAELVTTEELLARTLAEQKSYNTIAIEAKLAQLKTKTLEGAKIIANQIEGGLSKKTAEWMRNIGVIPLDDIKKEAGRILEASTTAKVIIEGCTVVITGPPNSGKSMLLNCLAGREKAIVTEIKGTTRDWVTAECDIGGVMMKIIDTAGIDEEFGGGDIEKSAQAEAVKLLKEADLVLVVLDASRPQEQLDERLIETIDRKKIVTVFNKIDLKGSLEGQKPIDRKTLEKFGKILEISAKFGIGIGKLLMKFKKSLKVSTFSTQQPVCITSRQEGLLERLKMAESKDEARGILRELINGSFEF